MSCDHDSDQMIVFNGHVYCKACTREADSMGRLLYGPYWSER